MLFYREGDEIRGKMGRGDGLFRVSTGGSSRVNIGEERERKRREKGRLCTPRWVFIGGDRLGAAIAGWSCDPPGMAGLNRCCYLLLGVGSRTF